MQVDWDMIRYRMRKDATYCITRRWCATCWSKGLSQKTHSTNKEMTIFSQIKLIIFSRMRCPSFERKVFGWHHYSSIPEKVFSQLIPWCFEISHLHGDFPVKWNPSRETLVSACTHQTPMTFKAMWDLSDMDVFFLGTNRKGRLHHAQSNCLARIRGSYLLQSMNFGYPCSSCRV